MYYTTSLQVQELLVRLFNNVIDSNTENKVVLTTNLSRGLPVKDIHKLAGPIADEWVYETLLNASKDPRSDIYDVQSKESSSLEDVSFRIKGIEQEIMVDVKSASLEKGKRAGKSSNLTSFRKIRPHYVNNPNSLFLILSAKHGPYIEDGKRLGFDFININLFDVKLISDKDLKFNTSMGDQFQIRDSMSVTQVNRTTDEFIQLIDSKFLAKYSTEKLEEIISKSK